MEYLFGSIGEAALREWGAGAVLYAFDFDGTLSPIVEFPERAELPLATAQRLDALAQVATVAVISGRSLSDLRERIANSRIRLLGNHGAEGLLTQKEAGVLNRVCAQWASELRKKDETCDLGRDFVLEDKGVSLSLHYRQSRDRERVLGLLLARAQALNPKPRLVLGKCVVNLVPQAAPHKGAALLELMLELGCSRAVFVGDDVTDEDAFRVDSSKVLGVRVEPSEQSHAAYFLEQQTEINRLLDHLISCHTS